MNQRILSNEYRRSRSTANQADNCENPEIGQNRKQYKRSADQNEGKKHHDFQFEMMSEDTNKVGAEQQPDRADCS
ncbi:hypothetical protein AMJ83_00235 [candidate division WOR_3 bacterium SM23_42]|uniref:Uncharacterized protein n=1 Tax=candidate division WOR_3 bacterium SM23_42 TaxID=1703779 RepID=A0A0S8FVI9_UNCW3|nr:MAG: hypothetical protein AMJ83_00235 [candidate division WOR_3 bacterium SM23_42]